MYTTAVVHPIKRATQKHCRLCKNKMPALPFVGLIFMLDSLFITNFFYIRGLRKREDVKCEDGSSSGKEKQTRTKFANHIMMTLSEEQREKIRRSRMVRFIGFLKATILGIVHHEKTTERQFVDWTPISHKRESCPRPSYLS